MVFRPQHATRNRNIQTNMSAAEHIWCLCVLQVYREQQLVWAWPLAGRSARD